jgi:hypothetical protein
MLRVQKAPENVDRTTRRVQHSRNLKPEAIAMTNRTNANPNMNATQCPRAFPAAVENRKAVPANILVGVGAVVLAALVFTGCTTSPASTTKSKGNTAPITACPYAAPCPPFNWSAKYLG